MPSQTRQRVPASGPAEGTTPVVAPPEPVSALGNQAVAAAAAEGQESSDPGRLTWEAALGSTVGGKLYDALAGQLTEDKLVGYANKAVDAAMAKVKAYLQGAADPSEQEAAALFSKEIDNLLRGMARSAVVDTSASEELTALVGGHPYEVALAALAGAAAYVLSNQDIPLIEQKLGLGHGFAIVAGIDVGRTLDLAVEQVRLGLKYSGGGADVSLVGDRFEDGGWQVTGKYSQKLGENEQLSVSGTEVQRPGQERSRVDLGYKNENLTAGAFWQRTHKQGGTLDTYGGNLGYKQNDLNAYVRGQVSSDDSWEVAGGLNKKFGDHGSLGVEGFGGQDAMGQQNNGVRAMFKWSF
ncbi:MAG: hypothetical protein ABIO70_08865 [Pseudomonadota bacterium]